ncbi:MAG: hypothetical protein O2783_08190 [Chloroflexi bacterium]|nr:hypothetical protein [Chloroflexota bacterium]
MTKAQIYREAAKMIESGEEEHSCRAIDFIAGSWIDRRAEYFEDNQSPATRAYARRMAPAKHDEGSWLYKYEGWSDDAAERYAEIYEWRIMALLFMAEVVENDSPRAQ